MGTVLFPVLDTSGLTDIVAPRRPIFARWERMHGAPIGYEVRKLRGDDHGKQYRAHLGAVRVQGEFF